ncbi:MAG: glycine-rich domain-containing protein [Salinarimonas sp.]
MILIAFGEIKIPSNAISYCPQQGVTCNASYRILNRSNHESPFSQKNYQKVANGVEKRLQIFPRKTDIEIKDMIKMTESYDLTKIRNRYMKENNITEESAIKHEIELKRFLVICGAYEGPIGMRGETDEFWHTFLVFTAEYQKFCKNIAGFFIHHSPNDDDTPVEARYMAARRFDAAYLATFGVQPHERGWPALGTSTDTLCMCGCGGPCGGCMCMEG